MKRLRDIRRSNAMRIEMGTIYGGMGTVKIGSWTGSVIWGSDEDGWEHVSVAPFDRTVTPTWDDMCKLKDIFFEDDEMAIQIHPRKSEYVNMVENCLHLWRPKDEALLEGLEKGVRM